MKNKHPIEIEHYEENTKELVDFIVGKLRYDKVIEFHQMLTDRYLIESQDETSRHRPKLSQALKEVSLAEGEVVKKLKEVWRICEPYTE